MPQLSRSLSLAECVFFGVGAILGAGIYALLGKVAGEGGNMTWVAFLIASVIAMLTAFSYAELSTTWPEAGGEYIYAGKAFGETAGLIAGVMVIMTGIISASTVALGFAGYFNELVKSNVYLAATGIILILFFVNMAGIRLSSLVNVIFTSIETAGLILIIYVAWDSFGKVNYFEAPPEGMHGILTASALCFFAFLGFEKIVKLAEETKNPEVNIRRALFISCAIVMMIYTAVALAVVSAIPFSELSASAGPLADVAALKFGKTGAILIAVVALFATGNTILSSMLGSSRVMLEIAEKKKSFQQFAQVSKRKVPVKALVAVLVISIAGTFIGNIENVAQVSNVFMFLTFLFVNASVIALRRKKNYKPKYKAPFTIGRIPLTALLGFLLTLLMLAYAIADLLDK